MVLNIFLSCVRETKKLTLERDGESDGSVIVTKCVSLNLKELNPKIIAVLVMAINTSS